ncbi:MAG: hypothetical protein LBI08_00715 [Methanomassiliicoccaceae archaeon]|jgi:hypothetical protein|nr:hypothetical protein [Methanomassiliicoccaceae archaeon]
MNLYRESQPVAPLWLSLVILISFIGIMAFSLYAVWGDDLSEGTSAVIVSVTVAIILTVSLFMIRIKVTVTDESLTVTTFRKRTIPMGDIENISTEDFKALRDFGGWGIRFGRKGWGYIAAGTDKGIRVHLKTGKSFLVSTKDQFGLESAMRMALKGAK